MTGNLSSKDVNRYPLVAYVDEALRRKVRAIQQEINQLTGARASLDYREPHITVGSEVLLGDEEVDTYVKDLRAAVGHLPVFSVAVKGFGFMDNWSGGGLAGNKPHVIYLKVLVTPELQRLVEVIRPVIESRLLHYEMPLPYNPHLTVAFSDLTEEGYKKAKKLYEGQNLSGSTIIRSISVVRHENVSNRNTEAHRILLGSR